MLRLLDVLLQLDHLKNAKASIPNDFSWYKRYVCILDEILYNLLNCNSHLNTSCDSFLTVFGHILQFVFDSLWTIVQGL